MRLYNTQGRLQNKNVSKYLISWRKKSRSKIQFQTKHNPKVMKRLFGANPVMKKMEVKL